MTAGGTNGGDEGLESSPKNRVKFLCSYGGKILLRPGDGELKYVGGETRMVAVPGDIKFSELMKKVNSMVEGDMILKFLVIPEELDTLVTVKSDEDVKHIVDEYRRLESEGTPKMRAFLFPLSPVIVENQMNPVDPYAIEQRYIEAINGIVRPSSNNSSGRLTPVNPMSNFSISSCTSPKAASPDACPFPMDPSVLNGNQLNRPPMPKVRSSPSLYSLNTLHSQNNNHSNHHVYQPHPHYHQQLQPYSVRSPRTSPGPHDIVRGALGHSHVPVDPYTTEQRYIEAINGIVRPSSNNTSGRLTPVNPMSNFSISPCTSPKSASPDACPFPMDPSVLNGNQLNRPPMPKVRSSPSLYSLNTLHPQNNNHSNHQVYQPHHYYHQNHQQLQPYSIQSPRTFPWPHDLVRGALGHGHVPMNRVYSVSRHNLGNGYPACTCCHDDSSAYASAGSSRRSSLSTSGRLDKPDSPSRRNFMLE